jgi:predicted adenine nucleotide alpha hydrolase (AANH) superfamily ATPase
MDDYRREQRKKKRGSHCIFGVINENGVGISCFCGCGWRGHPNKKHKRRIVKRALKNAFEKEIKNL